MIYNILINQRAIIENKWDLKANHIAVLESVLSFIEKRAGMSMTDENGVWFWVSDSLIVNQIPMFDIKARRCNDLIKDLCAYNLLQVNPNNRSLGKRFIRTGANISKYRGSQFIAKGMQKIADSNAKNCTPPMQKIADNNIINNNIINDNIKEHDEIKNFTESHSEDLNLFKEEKKEIISKDIIFPIVKKLSTYFPDDITKRLNKNDKLKWSDTIEKLIRLDKYTKEEIEKAVKVGRNDKFWKNNFLSINKLRKKDKQGVKYIQVFLNLDSDTEDDTGDSNFEYKPTDKPIWL